MRPFRLLLAIIITSTAGPASAQVPAAYYEAIGVADSCYNAQAYSAAATAFTKAFFLYKGSASDRYNAACSWALAGNADSAFKHLNLIAKNARFAALEHVQNDTDLKGLRRDPRWKPFIATVKKNKEEQEKALNKPLLHLLDSLEQVDQRWRNAFVAAVNEGKSQTDPDFIQAVKKVREADSIHYAILQEVFREHGYPGFDLVGKEGSHDFWLLVQHQDEHPEFQQQVLDAMKERVEAEQASGTDYAYLVDRVRVNTHRPQVYGTQMKVNTDSTSFEPDEVELPAELNARRARVGLPPIEVYIRQMNERYRGNLKPAARKEEH